MYKQFRELQLADFSIISCLKIEVIKSLSNRFLLTIYSAFIAK